MKRSAIIILIGLCSIAGYGSEITTLPKPPDYFAKSLAANPVDLLDDRYALKSLQSAASIRHRTVHELDNTSPDDPWITYCHVELTSFTDSLLGNISRNDLSPVTTGGRSRNKKYPGFYLNATRMGSRSALSQFEKDSLYNSVNKLLQSRFHIPREIDFISKYENVFRDSARTEFFGRTDIENVKISIGGWSGKFISVAIFNEYKGANSFLKKAFDYFRLPALKKEKIVVHKKRDEFLYLVKDKENMIILRGYRIIVNCPVISTGLKVPKKSEKVIELIKYYDEEFMP
ncbi:MAG: hypothetical protein JSW64_06975 [Candidatus Zixiibacteriota bacterium]|nr:MAG: hypothetical protein JSW64_06975 [candidate division Zixibacteria bacterium]